MDVKALADRMVELKQQKAKLLETHQKKVENATRQKEEAENQLKALAQSQKQIHEQQDMEIAKVEKAMQLAQTAANVSTTPTNNKATEEAVLSAVVPPTPKMVQEAGVLNDVLAKLQLPSQAQTELLSVIGLMINQATEANKEQARAALKKPPDEPAEVAKQRQEEPKETKKRGPEEVEDSSTMAD